MADAASSLQAAIEAMRVSAAAKPKAAVNDRSAPNIKGIMSEAKVAEYYAHVLDCNLESWIDTLSSVTFPTDMLPLSKADAAVIIEANADYKKRKLPKPDPKYFDALKSLISSVQSSIDKLANPSACGAVFVKLSCRSPKDATSKLRTARLYKQLTAALPAAASDNDKLVCLLKANTAVLPCYSAVEAIERILCSDRIAEDLVIALNATNISRYTQHIAVRTWLSHGVDSEFRGLVYQNELHALTQYNYIEHFARLPPNAERIASAIKSFYDSKVKQKLFDAGFRNFVIDFVVVERPHVASIAATPPNDSPIAAAATASTAPAINAAADTKTGANVDFVATKSNVNPATATSANALVAATVTATTAAAAAGSILKCGVSPSDSASSTASAAPSGPLQFGLDDIYVIEINPWGPSTDCGLFDYKTEHDKVMARGPFEFRVRSAPAIGIKDFVASAEKDMNKS